MIGKLLDHRYQVIRILATGGFGQTYIAQDTRRPGNPICVVKHLKPASSDPKIFETAKRLFHSEAETLEKLGSHEYIPRLLAYFDENQEFFLVQEYIDGHTLSEELIPGQRWSESQVMYLLQEILEILEFVHQQGVIHRDIKPDNIIRRASDYKLVLVDFGAVKQLRSSLVAVSTQPTATVAIGTPGYMPTEQGQGKPRPNSDIYSLGIIAIQALTGVSANQLQEDPDTGEMVWQYLAPINQQLAAVLTKMVRYHFKDRYQNATEALQACKAIANPHFIPPILTPIAENPNFQQIKPTPSEILGQQKTVAFAPANPVIPPATPPTTPQPHSQITPKEPNKADPLPLLIGLLLVGSAAVLAINFYPSLNTFTANLLGKNTNSAKNCSAVVSGNSNIRSQPSAINSDNIVQTISNDAKFAVTGRRTQRDWIEVKLNSKSLAWVHSKVITNNEEWISCLRDQGVSIKTLDDDTLIANRVIPKAQSKSVPKSIIVTPSPVNSVQPSSNSAKPPKIDKNAANNIVEQARQKYDSGDLLGAIATLKSIPESAASGIQETTKIIEQWQKDWSKAEALSNDINTALEQGQWDKVLAYRDHPEKLPNIKYWRDKLEPVFQKAAENVAKQVIPPETTPAIQNSPEKKILHIDKPPIKEKTSATATPSPANTFNGGF